jgi:hypothetical protein
MPKVRISVKQRPPDPVACLEEHHPVPARRDTAGRRDTGGPGAYDHDIDVGLRRRRGAGGSRRNGGGRGGGGGRGEKRAAAQRWHGFRKVDGRELARSTPSLQTP